jgi:hypothetical protein
MSASMEDAQVKRERVESVTSEVPQHSCRACYNDVPITVSASQRMLPLRLLAWPFPHQGNTSAPQLYVRLRQMGQRYSADSECLLFVKRAQV